MKSPLPCDKQSSKSTAFYFPSRLFRVLLSKWWWTLSCLQKCALPDWCTYCGGRGPDLHFVLQTKATVDWAESRKNFQAGVTQSQMVRDAANVHFWQTQLWVSWWHSSQGKIRRVHPLGDMNVWAKSHDKLASSCRDNVISANSRGWESLHLNTELQVYSVHLHCVIQPDTTSHAAPGVNVCATLTLSHTHTWKLPKDTWVTIL